jgi:hypothetical protein
LQQADQQGHFPCHFQQLHAAGFFRVAPCPARGGEDQHAAEHPGEDHRPGAEEFLLDPIIEQHADDRGGQETDEDGDGELESFRILATNAHDHPHHAFVIESEHGEDRATLNADGESIRRHLVSVGLGADAHHLLGHEQVAGGADGKVFGDAFDHAEDECLPRFHGFGRDSVGTAAGLQGICWGPAQSAIMS